MVVVLQVVAATRRHGMELVVGQASAECPARSLAGAVKPVIRVFYAIALVYCPQAPFIEWTIVGNQRQFGDFWRYLRPDSGEIGGIYGVVIRHAMHVGAKPRIVIGRGAYQVVKRFPDLPIADNHHAHAAHARTIPVGSLKIYGGKIFHYIK